MCQLSNYMMKAAEFEIWLYVQYSGKYILLGKKSEKGKKVQGIIWKKLAEDMQCVKPFSEITADCRFTK